MMKTFKQTRPKEKGKKGGCSTSRWPKEDGLQCLALLLVGSVL
ncbi:unnamed protein product [Linum tenue]|uniref:Uncharacterized protein n=1 Tax=Linum tenue TaxID=586396 RepID=A0AAV0NWR7_9ROSI|nr:unnamed protein product [Linum tenue]